METASSPVTCAACGFIAMPTIAARDAACAMCGWIDDFEQLVHPDLVYGANSGLSLRQAQRRARERLATVVTATEDYARDPAWRALRDGETPVDVGGPSSPVCYVGTPDRESYVPYWLR
jgi:hypothetical protein